MKKIFLSFLILVLFCLLFIHFCSAKVNAKQMMRIHVIEKVTFHGNIYTIIGDYKTGREYLVVSNNNIGFAVTLMAEK